jgi:hypothetical protein
VSFFNAVRISPQKNYPYFQYKLIFSRCGKFKGSENHSLASLTAVIIVTGLRGVKRVKLAMGIERDICACKR